MEPRGLGVAAATEQLFERETKRALFVSPEDDDAGAGAALVARAASDAGLRVLLLDLSARGVASAVMLDGATTLGVSDLLAGRAQFTDILRTDHYSECHVIAPGTLGPVWETAQPERLPVILDSLTTAYDLVVAECGAKGAPELQRLTGERTAVLVGVLDADERAVAQSLRDLEDAGFDPIPVVIEEPAPALARDAA